MIAAGWLSRRDPVYQDWRETAVLRRGDLPLFGELETGDQGAGPTGPPPQRALGPPLPGRVIRRQQVLHRRRIGRLRQHTTNVVPGLDDGIQTQPRRPGGAVVVGWGVSSNIARLAHRNSTTSTSYVLATVGLAPSGSTANSGWPRAKTSRPSRGRTAPGARRAGANCVDAAIRQHPTGPRSVIATDPTTDTTVPTAGSSFRPPI